MTQKPLEEIDLFDGTCITCGEDSHNGACATEKNPGENSHGQDHCPVPPPVGLHMRARRGVS